MNDISLIRRLEVATRTMLTPGTPKAGIAAARRSAGDLAGELRVAATQGPGPFTEPQARVLARSADFLDGLAAGGRLDDNLDRSAMIEATQSALLLDTRATRLDAVSGHVLLDVDRLTAPLPRVDATTGARPVDVLRLAAAGRLLEGVVPTSTRGIESGIGVQQGAVAYAVDGLAGLEREVAAMHQFGPASGAHVVRDIGIANIGPSGAVSDASRAAAFEQVVDSVRDLGAATSDGELVQTMTARLIELQPTVWLHHGQSDRLVDAVWQATAHARTTSAGAARQRAATDVDPIARLVDRAWGSAPPVGMTANYRTTALSHSIAAGTPDDVARDTAAIVDSFESSRPGRLAAMRAALATGTPATATTKALPERLRDGVAAVEHAVDGYDGPGHRITSVDDYVVQLRGLASALEATDPELRATFTPEALDRTYAELARANESLVAKGTDQQLTKWHLWPDRARLSQALVDARLLADMTESLAASVPDAI